VSSILSQKTAFLLDLLNTDMLEVFMLNPDENVCKVTQETIKPAHSSLRQSLPV